MSVKFHLTINKNLGILILPLVLTAEEILMRKLLVDILVEDDNPANVGRLDALPACSQVY